MSLKRFEQIKRYLYIFSSATLIKNYFNKLELLLSYIWNVLKQLYIPSTNVSIDKMVIRFSRRSVHTVRIKNKPTLESFKILSLCDFRYTFIFLPISHIIPSDVTKIGKLNQIGYQVYYFVKQLSHHQHLYNIYIDNY